MVDNRWLRRVVVFALAVACPVCAAPAAAMPGLTTIGPPLAIDHDPTALAFSPVTDYLATATYKQDAVATFAADTARGILSPVQPPLAVGADPMAMAFSPDGRFLATANLVQDSVSMFSVSKTGALGEISGPPAETGDEPTDLAFNPDGDLLVTVNQWDDPVAVPVSVFRVESSGVLVPLDVPQTPFQSHPSAVAFTPEGLLVVLNDYGSSVSTFSVSPNGHMTHVDTSALVTPRPNAMAVSRDGRRIAVSGVHGIQMLSMTAGGQLSVLDGGYADRVPVLKFSPDGRLLVAADPYETDGVLVFSVASDGSLTALDGPPLPPGTVPVDVSFSRDGKLVAVADSASPAIVALSASERGLMPLAPPVVAGAPSDLAFSADGRLLATVIHDEVSVLTVGDDGIVTSTAPAVAGDWGLSVAFDPSRRRLATVNGNGETASIYSVSEQGALTLEQELATGDWAAGVSFSSDGRFLAVSGSSFGAPHVWLFRESVGGAWTQIDASAVGPAGRAVFSPTANVLVTTEFATDQSKAYAVSPSGELTPLAGSAPSGGSAAFSADGQRVATVVDGSVTISSVSPVGGLSPLGQPSFVNANLSDDVALNPDGGVLAVARFDELELFSVSSTGAVTPIGAPSRTGWGSANPRFSPDGRLVAVASGGSLSVFSVAAPVLDTWFSAGPPAQTGSAEWTAEYDATYPSRFECRLDDAPSFTPCVTAGIVNEGAHALLVRARDLTGKVDSTPASQTWVVDTTAPSTVTAAQPAAGATNLEDSALFSWFPATDGLTGIDHYSLLVDGTPVSTVPAAACGATCSTPPETPLSDGVHEWQVRAVDRVGNASTSPSRAFSVDAAPPSPFGLVGPGDDVATTDRKPRLSWDAAVDAGVGIGGYDVVLDEHVVARLDPFATAFAPTSPLAEGRHTWRIVAKDAYGREGSSATRGFVVDGTPPSAVLKAAPNPL